MMIKDTISYEDFAKLDIRIATVVGAELVEGADKLLKLTLDVGEEVGERTVMAGIKAWYQPEDLLGRQVVFLANLEPRKLRGIFSQGMILAGGDEEAILLQPEKPTEPGTAVR